MRKRVIVGVLALLILAGGGWLVLGGGPPAGVEAASRGAPVEVVVRDRARSPELGPTGRAAANTEASVGDPTRSKRDAEALRERILANQRARERDRTEPLDSAVQVDRRKPEPVRPPPVANDDGPASEGIHVGDAKLAYLREVIDNELLPLTDECYTLARKAQPELLGLLNIEVELVGDRELGGVVEAVELGPDNDLDSPELVECVRESLLSITYPPPPENGRESIVLSLRFDDE